MGTLQINLRGRPFDIRGGGGGGGGGGAGLFFKKEILSLVLQEKQVAQRATIAHLRASMS